jgi:hypothetical protein
VKILNLYNIFFDDKGNFVWASIAAFVALIAALVSLYNVYKTNKSNFKSNIVSKSRIEWIQEVRKQSVAFISSFYKLINYIKGFDYDYFRDPDHKNRIDRIEKDQELSRLISELKEKGTLLILYFGPDKSGNNEFIDYIVNHILEIADGMGKYYDVDYLLAQEKSIISFKDFLRVYFKAEWKRANGQIKDSKVQAYLEKDKLYRDIMEIYRDGLASHKENTEVFYNSLRDKYKD